MRKAGQTSEKKFGILTQGARKIVNLYPAENNFLRAAGALSFLLFVPISLASDAILKDMKNYIPAMPSGCIVECSRCTF